MGDESAAGIKGAWKRRDIRFLVAGFSVSSAGDWLYSVALIVFVFERTGSAFWVGLSSILRLAPYIVFSPFAGALADRYDKRRVMIGADLTRAVLMLLLTIVATTQIHVIAVILLAFLVTAAGTFYGPAFSAALPHLVDEDELAGVNALVSSVDTTALVLGPAVGGLLLVLGSPALAFGVNAVTFVISVLTLLPVRAAAGVEGSEEHKSIFEEVADGIRALFGARDVVVVVLFVMGAAFLYGHELVLLVLVAEDRLALGAEGVGWLDAAVGAGGLVAATFTGKLARAEKTSVAFLGSVLCCGLPLAVLVLTRDAALALVLMGVVGVGTIVMDVLGTTIMQRSLSPGVLARVFGLLDSVSVAAILIGSLLAPLLVTTLGLEGALLAAGSFLPVGALLGFRRIVRAAGASEAEKERLRPLVELLRTMTIFEDATEQMLERLAASCTRIDVPAGATVIEEGAPADDLFVVEEGSFDVVFSGAGRGAEKINEMHAGDHFGEIGLIERVPRTASVVATTDAVLYRIDGRTFVDTLTSTSAMPATVLRGVRHRLARTHPHLVTDGSELA